MRDASLSDFFDDDDDLPYYDHVAGELKGSQISKAKKFVKLNLVKPESSGTWLVLPIEGYNTRTYIVQRDGNFWSCNCQYNRTKGKICSHILAVWLYEKILDLEKKKEREEV